MLLKTVHHWMFLFCCFCYANATKKQYSVHVFKYNRKIYFLFFLSIDCGNFSFRIWTCSKPNDVCLSFALLICLSSPFRFSFSSFQFSFTKITKLQTARSSSSSPRILSAFVVCY